MNFELELDVLGRSLVAILLSGILGWEREAKGKAAGVRTHMLVGLAATLFVTIGELMVQRFDHDLQQLRYDPVRVLEAMVTGVSFLGAGTIFISRGKEKVQGLTTAASILVTSAVGMMVGLRYYILACGVTALIFVVLHGLAYVKDRIEQRRAQRGP
ncbi:MgtC/SapB family protein [Luteolibacter sp. Populi]|uniref:MgtC/SapB family protein n=1 Tax=Luteolibacter sp. Populi TaxID=3230487 RepID=UPI00346678A7